MSDLPPTDPSPQPAAPARAGPGPLDAPATPARLGDSAFGLITLGLVVLGYFTVGALTQLLNVAFGIWFAEVEVFFGIAWVSALLFRRDPFRELSLAFPGWEAAALGFLAGTVNLVTIVFPLQAVSVRIVPAWFKEHSVDVAQIFNHQSKLELGILMLGVTIAAPVGEELFFRGVLQPNLAKLFHTVVPSIALTAVTFSALHLDAVGFLARAELGVLFGVLAWRTGSIWPGVFAHAANNLVSTALYFVVKDPEEDVGDGPPLKWMALLLVAGAPVVLALVRRAIRSARVVQDAPRIPARAPGFFPTVSGWAAGGVLAVCLLVAVDQRGIRLNFEDVMMPLPAEKATASAEEKQVRKELDDTRARARSGAIPIADYLQARKDARTQLELMKDEPPEAPKAKEAPLPPSPVPGPSPRPAK